MVNSFSLSMDLPCTLFETVSRFNDVNADDMQCGDMGERELLALGLRDISAKVDPYRLMRYDFPLNNPLDTVFHQPPSGRKISHQECVRILFAEMKELSALFSFQGEYKMLIGEMIDHFQFGNGSGFYSQRLNSAFHSRVDKYNQNDPVNIIESTLKKELHDKSRDVYFPAIFHKLKINLLKSQLNKFNSSGDRVNGLGISVHDIAAQKIRLLDIQRYAMGWSATLHLEAQDHFGLDVIDISNKLYKEFRFFRIWFFLQRHRDFAFKPFFTNFGTIERIGDY